MPAFRCLLGPYRSAIGASVIATVAAIGFARSQMPAEPRMAESVRPDTTSAAREEVAQAVVQTVRLDAGSDIRIIEICAIDRRPAAPGPARPS